MSTATGWRMTACATRSQRAVRAGSTPSAIGRNRCRRPPSDRALTRCPSMPRTAGRKVSAKTTEQSTTSAPAMPIERIAGASNRSRPDRPMATAMPLKATALPAVAMARSTASPTERPRSQLLAEAADDEQRVVDRERESEHRRDVQDEDAHLDLLGDDVDQARGCSGSRDRPRGAASRPRRSRRRRG